MKIAKLCLLSAVGAAATVARPTIAGADDTGEVSACSQKFKGCHLLMNTVCIAPDPEDPDGHLQFLNRWPIGVELPWPDPPR